MPGRFRFFDEDLNAEVQRGARVKRELAKAINGNAFHLALQPKVCLNSGRVIGLEALSRWRHPTLGNVAPVEFISIAEATNLILPLSDWLLREVCQVLVSWEGKLLDGLSVAINVSAIQLSEAGFADKTMRIINEYSVRPDLLELEITETAAFENLPLACEQLAQLHEHGVRIAIDDFGAGFASLALLTSAPADTLKIDMSFVQRMSNSKRDAAAVGTTITLAHSLGMKAVAEGVETLEQLTYLRELQCDFAQGYYFCPPVPESDFGAWHMKNYPSVPLPISPTVMAAAPVSATAARALG